MTRSDMVWSNDASGNGMDCASPTSKRTRAAGTFFCAYRMNGSARSMPTTYERPFRDLFAIQDEIVSRLTALLPGKLTEAARKRNAHRYTRNLEAYDYFLRAQAHFLVRQPGMNDAARTLYRRALELDPKFARAYAGLAMTYAMDQRLRGRGEAANALTLAFELAESARLIDPDIPEVYWALASAGPTSMPATWSTRSSTCARRRGATRRTSRPGFISRRR